MLNVENIHVIYSICFTYLRHHGLVVSVSFGKGGHPQRRLHVVFQRRSSVCLVWSHQDHRTKVVGPANL